MSKLSNRIVRHIRGQAVGYVALVIALGGTSMAATGLITGRQIANHTLTPVKFDPRSIPGHIAFVARIINNGRVVYASPRIRTSDFSRSRVPNSTATSVYGVVHLSKALSGHCALLAHDDGGFGIQDGAAVSVSTGGLASTRTLRVTTYDPDTEGIAGTIDIVAVCP